MKDGEDEWAEHARQIKAGQRKSFVQHLEDRGLIHDVVGYALYVLDEICTELLLTSVG